MITSNPTQRAYNKYIHYNTSFWNRILDSKDPKEIARRLRIGFMGISPMLKTFAGAEVAGNLCADFENLAKEVQYTKTYDSVKDRIKIWRMKSANGENHKRIPEDQSKLFTDNKWNKFKKESKENEQHT